MGRLIDCNDVYNAIQITTDNFGVIKGVVESNMLTMLSKIETVEVIPKDQYEARLKADMVVILDKIRVDIEQVKSIMNEEIINHNRKDLVNFVNGLNQSLAIIDKYRAESEDKK